MAYGKSTPTIPHQKALTAATVMPPVIHRFTVSKN
jgi:hypothetical protein